MLTEFIWSVPLTFFLCVFAVIVVRLLLLLLLLLLLVVSVLELLYVSFRFVISRGDNVQYICNACSQHFINISWVGLITAVTISETPMSASDGFVSGSARGAVPARLPVHTPGRIGSADPLREVSFPPFRCRKVPTSLLLIKWEEDERMFPPQQHQ